MKQIYSTGNLLIILLSLIILAACQKKEYKTYNDTKKVSQKIVLNQLEGFTYDMHKVNESYFFRIGLKNTPGLTLVKLDRNFEVVSTYPTLNGLYNSKLLFFDEENWIDAIFNNSRITIRLFKNGILQNEHEKFLNDRIAYSTIQKNDDGIFIVCQSVDNSFIIYKLNQNSDIIQEQEILLSPENSFVISSTKVYPNEIVLIGDSFYNSKKAVYTGIDTKSLDTNYIKTYVRNAFGYSKAVIFKNGEIANLSSGNGSNVLLTDIESNLISEYKTDLPSNIRYFNFLDQQNKLIGIIGFNFHRPALVQYSKTGMLEEVLVSSIDMYELTDFLESDHEYIVFGRTQKITYQDENSTQYGYFPVINIINK